MKRLVEFFRSRKPVQNGVLALVGVAAGLLAIEALGHGMLESMKFRARAYVYEADPALGYRCLGQEKAASASDVFAIALGDSFTGDTRGDKMYPRVLEQRLGRKVLNLGCSGYGTLQESILARRWLHG